MADGDRDDLQREEFQFWTSSTLSAPCLDEQISNRRRASMRVRLCCVRFQHVQNFHKLCTWQTSRFAVSNALAGRGSCATRGVDGIILHPVNILESGYGQKMAANSSSRMENGRRLSITLLLHWCLVRVRVSMHHFESHWAMKGSSQDCEPRHPGSIGSLWCRLVWALENAEISDCLWLNKALPSEK